MDYKQEIIKKLEIVDDERLLKMIYGFVKGAAEVKKCQLESEYHTNVRRSSRRF